MDNFKYKYLKYKKKYHDLLQYGGTNCLMFGHQQFSGQCWHDALAMSMMQSDALKDIFIRQLFVVDIEGVHAELTDLFSPTNINKNAFLLPFNIYIYYLKHKTLSDRIISKFLSLSKRYIESHIPRALNRIRFDNDMQKYDKQSHTPNLFEELPELEHSLKQAPTYDNQTKIRRKMSIRSSLSCTTVINDIYELIDPSILTQTPESKAKLGGNLYESNLAMEILNMYLIRSNPKEKDMYIDTLSLFIENKTPPNFALLKKLFNDNLIGINVAETITSSSGIGYHTITLYKCDGQEILYDDNKGVMPIKVYDAIFNYIASNGNISEYTTFRDIIRSKTPYTREIYNLNFARKRKFNPADNEIQKEIKFILNKFNGFLYNSILLILFRRLVELTKATADNFHTQMQTYTKKIHELSLFDKEKFKEIYGIYFEINMLVLEAKDKFNSMFQ
jgi:hypothetical protein